MPLNVAIKCCNNYLYKVMVAISGNRQNNSCFLPNDYFPRNEVIPQTTFTR